MTTNNSHTVSECAVIGHGRLGTALSRALRAAGVAVEGPLGRGIAPASATVILCVPDAEIAGVAAALPSSSLIGHCSGALGLDVLGPNEGFGLHPLMTFTGDTESESATLLFEGVPCAIGGTTPRALEIAVELATRLGMNPHLIDDHDRALYHAGAVFSAGFMVVLADAAERLTATAGMTRDELLPLMRATLDNWARLGAEKALTGPIPRKDEETVARQRAAIAAREPDLVDLFDALVVASKTMIAQAKEKELAS